MTCELQVAATSVQRSNLSGSAEYCMPEQRTAGTRRDRTAGSPTGHLALRYLHSDDVEVEPLELLAGQRRNEQVVVVVHRVGHVELRVLARGRRTLRATCGPPNPARRVPPVRRPRPWVPPHLMRAPRVEHLSVRFCAWLQRRRYRGRHRPGAATAGGAGGDAGARRAHTAVVI